MNKNIVNTKLEDLSSNYVDEIEMPFFPKLVNKYIDGTNAYEGYQRGWGLKHSNLFDQIRSDKLFKYASFVSNGLSLVSELKRMNMFLIILKYLKNLDEGDWIEFGSYKGGNIIFLAVLSKVLGFENKILACDSFKGIPQTDEHIDLHNEGDFSDSDFNKLKIYIKNLGLDNIKFVKGFFSESLKCESLHDFRFSFAHIDCDIFSSCKESFEYLKDRTVDSGYLVFDDANAPSCIGATRFVEKVIIREAGLCSEQIWPHFVFRFPHHKLR